MIRKKNYAINSIEYIAHGCNVGCPEFIISIDKEKNGEFNAQNYNWFDKNYSYNLEPNDVDGKYKTKISDNHFEEIYGIISYLDIPNLDILYYSGAMHSSTATLKITYDNGNVKSIKDYGLIGTYGLKRIHEMFYQLRFNQDWK